MTTPSVIIGRDGRAKAYRPLPVDARATAIAVGLAAYERGDFFEAHEDLEPAWMGSADPVERAWLQGLIKVAAAYVHGTRGNPAGIARNLEGARRLLVDAEESGWPGSIPTPILASVEPHDLTALIVAIDQRLADLLSHPDGPRLGPPDIRRSQV
jgi:Domain of unknown function (DUF309)